MALRITLRSNLPRVRLRVQDFESIPERIMHRVGVIGKEAIVRELSRAKFLGRKASSGAPQLVRFKIQKNRVEFDIGQFYQKFVEEGLKKSLFEYIRTAFKKTQPPPVEALSFRWGPAGPELGGDRPSEAMSRGLDRAEKRMADVVFEYFEGLF